MAKPRAFNATLDPDLVNTFNTVILPKTRFRSLSAWINNELLKLTRNRLPEIRKAKAKARDGEIAALLDRAIEAAITK
jgi:Asp-tRNA(Asn)/Glu-tRNA(Gln) amidotransferase B subunit